MDKSTLPVELQVIDFPDWVCWLAQDADGAWWGYEVEPLQHDNGWDENEIGRRIGLLTTLPCANWREQLIRVN